MMLRRFLVMVALLCAPALVPGSAAGLKGSAQASALTLPHDVPVTYAKRRYHPVYGYYGRPGRRVGHYRRAYGYPVYGYRRARPVYYARPYGYRRAYYGRPYGYRRAYYGERYGYRPSRGVVIRF